MGFWFAEPDATSYNIAFDKLSPMVHRKRVARCQSKELVATGDEQCVGADQKTIRPLRHKRRKGGIDHRDSAQLLSRSAAETRSGIRNTLGIFYFNCNLPFLGDS